MTDDSSNLRDVRESLIRIENKILEFETFYSSGLNELSRLNRALEGLDTTINSTVKTLIVQASGIVPGGLIPIRSAVIMVIVALGLTNAKEVGEHMIRLVHTIMGAP